MHSGTIATELLEHSKAKVQLYSDSLSGYLNILRLSGSVDTIYPFDLLCGEGLYSNNEKALLHRNPYSSSTHTAINKSNQDKYERYYPR
jgi:hypothetical protein